MSELDGAILGCVPTYTLVDAKEKYGVLRYVVDIPDDTTPAAAAEVLALIQDAERRSATVCETCGQPGTMREFEGWQATRCQTCAEAWLATVNRPLESRWERRWGQDAPPLEYSAGWDAIVERLDDAIVALVPNYRATQVKTKFGILVFRVDLPLDTDSTLVDEVYSLVEAAELESTLVCESCGRPGQLRSYQGWFSTTCDDRDTAMRDPLGD